MDAREDTADQAFWVEGLLAVVDRHISEKMIVAQNVSIDVSGNAASAITMDSPFVVAARTNVSPKYVNAFYLAL